MDKFLEKKRAFSLFIVFSIAIFSVYSPLIPQHFDLTLFISS